MMTTTPPETGPLTRDETVRVTLARKALTAGPSTDLEQDLEDRLRERAENLEYHVQQLLDVIGRLAGDASARGGTS